MTTTPPHFDAPNGITEAEIRFGALAGALGPSGPRPWSRCPINGDAGRWRAR